MHYSYNRRVTLHVESGVDTTDFAKVAREEHLNKMEIEALKIQRNLEEVVRDLAYFKRREERHRDTNGKYPEPVTISLNIEMNNEIESTNSRVMVRMSSLVNPLFPSIFINISAVVFNREHGCHCSHWLLAATVFTPFLCAKETPVKLVNSNKIILRQDANTKTVWDVRVYSSMNSNLPVSLAFRGDF